MNHAHWNADQVRQRNIHAWRQKSHRAGFAPKLNSPHSFQEPVTMTLAEAKKQQKNYRALINGERDGSIPLNRDIRLMIAEDERHLDLLQN